ncbi:MAG: hypothetical protein SOY30_15965 [Eubacteriales bacterium]|nr:hypothetical protein [Eubacteriales bacterium]
MRLIDADAFARWLDKNHYIDKVTGKCDARQNKVLGIVISAVKNPEICPTVDAEPVQREVEVIHCHDCKHYLDGICEQIEYIMDGYYRGTFEVKRPDDFCSYGEKKGGNTNEREKQKGLKPNAENHP